METSDLSLDRCSSQFYGCAILKQSKALPKRFSFLFDFFLEIGFQIRARSSMGSQIIRFFNRIFLQLLPYNKARQIQPNLSN